MLVLQRHAPGKAIILFLLPLFFVWAVPCGSEPEKQILRLAYLQNDLHHLALWVALDKGYFRDQGLDARVVGVFRAGPEIMSAFAAGELDAAYVGEAPATVAAARGTVRIKVLAQANTEGTSLVVRADMPASGPADLAGRTVAVPGHGSVQDFLLRRFLRDAGIEAWALKIMVLSPPEMLVALKTAQIDAFVAWEPYPSRAVAQGGKRLSDSKAIWPGHPCCVVAADRRFLEARPGDAKSLLRAHVRATDFILAHPDEAAAVAVKYTGMEPAVVAAAMREVSYAYQPSVAGEEEFARFLSVLGYVNIPDPKAFVRDFIDQGPLRDIKE